MKKRARPSVDGFVPRRSGYVVGQEHRTLGEPGVELGHGTREIDSEGGLGIERDMQSDIHTSLAAIDQEPQDDSKKDKKRRRLRRRDKIKKPISKKRKILKISLIVFAALIALFVGYFIWKFIQTGGKVLTGSILDIFQHQKLAEDANGRTNVLIFGTSGWTMDQNNGWDGGLLTDSIMVVSIDQNSYNAYAVSLPRDLYVGTCTSTGKLNEVYYCGYIQNNKQEDGAKALMKEVSAITGLEVQYYVHANWTAFEKGVDAVGGIDITIESDDPRGIYDPWAGINFKNGEKVHLNGKMALALARARDSSGGGYGLGSNYARERNQQKILNALMSKVSSTSTLLNPAAISNLMDALGSNFRTNFQTAEARALIDIAKNTREVKSLPLNDRPNGQPNLIGGAMINGISYEIPAAGRDNYTDIREYILKSVLGEEYVQIDVLNGSGESGLAQTKANLLKQQGYGIGAVANSPIQIDETVRIFRVTEGHDKVAKSLEEKFGTTVQSLELTGYTPEDGSDFVIVFGKG